MFTHSNLGRPKEVSLQEIAGLDYLENPVLLGRVIDLHHPHCLVHLRVEGSPLGLDRAQPLKSKSGEKGFLDELDPFEEGGRVIPLGGRLDRSGEIVKGAQNRFDHLSFGSDGTSFGLTGDPLSKSLILRLLLGHKGLETLILFPKALFQLLQVGGEFRRRGFVFPVFFFPGLGSPHPVTAVRDGKGVFLAERPLCLFRMKEICHLVLSLNPALEA